MNWKFWTWDLWTYRRKLRFRAKDVEEQVARVAGLAGDLEAIRTALMTAEAPVANTADMLDLVAAFLQHHKTVERQRDEERRIRQAAEAVAVKASRDVLSVRVLVKLTRQMPTKPQLLQTLRGVTENTEWWQVVHAALNERERMCAAAVAEPGLANEEVQFRRGCLYEVQQARAEWLAWHVEAHKEEEEK